MMKKYTNFVAIDVETTGLSDDSEIIEVGLAIVEDGAVVRTWQSLVRPEKPIPKDIAIMTGISNEMVADAPAWSEIEDEFLQVIDGHWLLAHNYLFDKGRVEFQLGRSLPNDWLDSHDMAKLFLPTLSSYKLVSIATHLHIPDTNHHRALNDAVVCAQVFLKLMDDAKQLDPFVLHEMAVTYNGQQESLFANSSCSLGDLLFRLAEAATASAPALDSLDFFEPSYADPYEMPQLRFANAEAFFAQDGILAKMKPDFQYRAPQVDMLDCIKQAFATDKHALIEAGTGTGKSFAYLVPALLWSFEHDARVVIATGTNLGGKIFVGDAWYASGPDGMHAANALTESLKAAGLPLRRFKTGTPARVHRRSIDFSKLECQPGDPDNELQPFSFMTDAPMHNKVECWIAYTNPETHRIILDNIQRSPLYGGMIEGVGPRYCPSIEDKVVRFAGKDRHPIFVEPCGENTEEMYLQGASSSLPEDVQNAFYRSIKGFENIEIMRPAYAIEYDCVDPTRLEATLESKVVRGLYGAGQFNGTSGYEEAAAQGLLAGLNAARNALGESQLILPRQSSYLGTLVDDLVTKGVMDPYRMPSRSEYRLTLRQDNADTRLTPIGREYGLVQDDRWTKYQQTQAVLDAERHRLHDAHLRTADLRAAMEAAGLAPAAEGGIAEELLRRPEIDYPLIAGMIGWGEGITPMLAERLETEIKYAGYIARQDRMIHEVARHEKTLIPEDFSYTELTGLTLEAREKLARIRPMNLGQAGRIPGVSPSDVAQLSIALAAGPRKD